MAANSVILLPSSSHSADSTNTPIIGEKFKGAGFYGMGDGFHTVQVQVTSFTGIIKIQGSLATNPGNDDWVDINFVDEALTGGIVDTTGVVGGVNAITEISVTSSSLNKIYNFKGNFVWIRANVVSWTDGNINRILLNF